jgi:hypothetical protein
MKGVIVVAVLLLGTSAGGCVARNRINSNCRWTNDASSGRDSGQPTDVQHLMTDAMVAEDLAIRYADATRGRRSGHFVGWAEYEAAREHCMAILFAAAARTHNVDPEQVRDLLRRRPLLVDVSVVLSFAFFYVLMSNAVAGGIVQQFPVGERTPTIVASLLVAPVLSACAGLTFGIWASAIEMIRFGNMHISYRVDRLPWSHHKMELVAVGVLIFLATAAFRHYRERREPGFTALKSDKERPKKTGGSRREPPLT